MGQVGGNKKQGKNDYQLSTIYFFSAKDQPVKNKSPILLGFPSWLDNSQNCDLEQVMHPKPLIPHLQ